VGLPVRGLQSYGWDWVGRIRNGIKYFNQETGRWCYTDSLYPRATQGVQHLGEVTLSRRCRYRFRLYLVRAHKPRFGRPRKGPRGIQPNEWHPAERDDVQAPASSAMAAGHFASS
jgi:hypothetical protein